MLDEIVAEPADREIELIEERAEAVGKRAQGHPVAVGVERILADVAEDEQLPSVEGVGRRRGGRHGGAEEPGHFGRVALDRAAGEPAGEWGADIARREQEDVVVVGPELLGAGGGVEVAARALEDLEISRPFRRAQGGKEHRGRPLEIAPQPVGGGAQPGRQLGE